VQVEAGWLKATRTFFTLGGIDLVPFDEIEHRGVHALDRRGGRPEAQRDLLELPALSELGGDSLGAAAVRIDVVEAAVLGGQKFARRQKLLLSQQSRYQPRESTAALVELHRRRSPRCEGAGRLAAGEAERLGHGLGVEPAQPADRRSGAERTEHARAVPALRPERGVIEADPDPRRHLASGGDGGHQLAAR
jgi:hypothetical protein